MDLTLKNRKLFNRYDNKVFSKLKLGNNSLFLNGSFRHPIFSLYSADIDLYQPLKDNDRSKLILFLDERIPQMNKLLNFVELKIDDKKFKTKQGALKNLDLIDSCNRVKLDVWVWSMGFCEEVTIIYDFNKPIESGDFIESISQDVKKFGKKKMFFKALKRKALLLDAFDLKKEREDLDKILLNPINGFLYITIERLKTLLTVKRKNLKAKAYDNLKESVRKLGLLTPHLIKLFDKVSNPNINKIVSSLNKSLNEKVSVNYVGGSDWLSNLIQGAKGALFDGFIANPIRKTFGDKALKFISPKSYNRIKKNEDLVNQFSMY